MRPAGRDVLDSLYFSYPQFSAPANRAHLSDHTPVAIVGAGPIGMTAALGLAREGIRSVIFESKSTFNDGSRAICVARSSFRILERIGAVEPFLKKSLEWTTGRTFYRGKQILEFQMPDSDQEKYRPMYNLQQQYIEQFLWDAITQEPLIETRWRSKVIGIADTEEGARLEVSDPKGSYNIEASYVLAADGARSQIRKMRELRLKGENYEGQYVIADVQMDHDYPTIRRALFDPDCRRGATILIHKQPDKIWRIDYQLNNGEDVSGAVAEETVRESVTGVLKEIGYEGEWELEWWSTYTANTLALDDYRDGRIFFIGDSAHIVPIFGVRGLNNGLADAHNIAWKIGWVLKGQAKPVLLDSYTPERRGATLDVFANATKSARFMTPPTHGWKLMRDAALNLSLNHAFAGQLANPRQMTPYTYYDSPIVCADDPAFSDGPVAGAMLPDARIGDEHLSNLLGPEFSIIVFENSIANILDIHGVKTVMLEHNSEAAKRLSAGPRSAYLIRPDLHIAARWHEATPAAIKLGLKRAIGEDL